VRLQSYSDALDKAAVRKRTSKLDNLHFLELALLGVKILPAIPGIETTVGKVVKIKGWRINSSSRIPCLKWKASGY